MCGPRRNRRMEQAGIVLAALFATIAGTMAMKTVIPVAEIYFPYPTFTLPLFSGLAIGVAIARPGYGLNNMFLIFACIASLFGLLLGLCVGRRIFGAGRVNAMMFTLTVTASCVFGKYATQKVLRRIERYFFEKKLAEWPEELRGLVREVLKNPDKHKQMGLILTWAAAEAGFYPGRTKESSPTE